MVPFRRLARVGREASCCFHSKTSSSTRTDASCVGATDLIAVEPQVFDLLTYLILNRDRVVSRDDIFAAVWHGRIVSESTLTTRLNAVRAAIGDSGDEQRLIKTLPRKGVRFVAAVQESERSEAVSASDAQTQVPAPHWPFRTSLRSQFSRLPT